MANLAALRQNLVVSIGQLSAFARQIAPAVKSLAQQNNGIIRLLRAKLDATN